VASDSAPDLRVVVVSYNVRCLLEACLRSLYREAGSEGITADVWVVDNCSSDGSADLVAEEFPQAHLIRAESNLGFACAVNRALQETGCLPGLRAGMPILLLNPDTEVLPGALSLLLDDLATLPKAAVVAPGLRYGDGSFQHSAFRFPGLLQTAFEFFPIHWRLLESRLNGRYPRQERRLAPFRCDHPLGAAMLLRAEALHEVGGFDRAYFMYCEEIDWCWRAAKLGWEIWSDPRAIVVHHSGRSASQVRVRMYRELWRSRYGLFAKHRGRLYEAAARGVVRAGVTTELLALRCGWKRMGDRSDCLDRRKAYLSILDL